MIWHKWPDFEPTVFAICVLVPEFDDAPHPLHVKLARMFLGAKEWTYAKPIEWWESTGNYENLKTVTLNDPFLWRGLPNLNGKDYGGVVPIS